MFDHIGITVRDLDRSRTFYADALEPLGIRELMQFENPDGNNVEAVCRRAA